MLSRQQFKVIPEDETSQLIRNQEIDKKVQIWGFDKRFWKNVKEIKEEIGRCERI